LEAAEGRRVFELHSLDRVGLPKSISD
jgi:hypothetical protein